MTISIRLEPHLLRKIEEVSRRRGVNRSVWLRQAIVRQLEQEAAARSPYEIWREVTAGLSERAEPRSSSPSTEAELRSRMREHLRGRHDAGHSG